MKKRISYGIFIIILVLLSVCLFACNNNDIISLNAKYEHVRLPLNSSLYIENYIEYEGKGKFNYAIENPNVLLLKGSKVTAVGVGEGTVIISSGTHSVRFTVQVTDGTIAIVNAINAEYEYDGTLKNIAIEGDLPENAIINYFCDGKEFLGAKEIGVYQVEIEVIADNLTISYYTKKAVLTITKAMYDMRNISFASKEYTYDGTEKLVEISGSLPDGVTVSYLSNKATNAGTYWAKAVFGYDGKHYEPIDDMTAKLVINRKNFILNTNGFVSTVINYDGLGHKVELTSLPDGLIANYFIVDGKVEVPMPTNGLVDSGTYTIKVAFEPQINSVFDLNYNPVQSRSITFLINKANFVSPSLQWKASPTQGFIYDGSAVTVGTGQDYDVGLVGEMPKGLNGEFPDGVTVSYKYLENGLYKDISTANFVDAGRYSIKATFTMPDGYDDNYTQLEDTQFTIIIQKAVYDMSDVVFEPIDSENKSFAVPQEFDENTHNFAVNAHQQFFDDVDVKYYLTTNNDIDVEISEINLYNVGSYKISAKFELKSNKINYNLIPTKTINVVITRLCISLNGILFEDIDSIYNQSEHFVTVENLPSGVSIIYENNFKINAGIYNVIARPIYKDIDINNYAFLKDDNVVSSFTATLEIKKATLTDLDVPFGNYSTIGGVYCHTKTLADYPIIGAEDGKMWWVDESIVPIVSKTSYKVAYNPDKVNYISYEYRLDLELQKAVIDGNTIVLESQFVPYTSNIVKPNFTVDGDILAVSLSFDCDSDLISIGKHDISSIQVSLNDTDNYELINIPTIENRFICIYSADLYNYDALQLTKYKGANTTVTIMDGTKSIKSGAFENNTYIRNIIVPDSVMAFGARAFNGVSNLQEITLPFVGKTPNSGEKLGQVFGSSDNKSLPQSLVRVNISLSQTIYESAFSYAEYLLQVNYLSDVTSLQRYAFSDCTNLEEVVLGDNISSIGERIFYKCFNLKEIRLPFIGQSINDIRTIEYLIGLNSETNSYVNYNCKKLQLTSESIAQLPDKFLMNFSSLTTIVLPSSIISIGNECFSGIYAPIVLNNSFTSLTYGIFKGYLGNTITIPASVQSISAAAFYGAVNLITIDLPKKVTSIGENAFYNVNATITFASDTNISTIGNRAFANYKGSTINLPTTVTTLGNSAFEGSAIKSILVGADIINIGGSVFKKCTSLTTVTLKTSYIANKMFDGCTVLNNITLENVEEIYAFAFKDCISLSTIGLSDKIVNIREHAFDTCLNLKIVNILSEIPPTLGIDAFNKKIAIRVYVLQTADKVLFEKSFISNYGYNNMTFYDLL